MLSTQPAPSPVGRRLSLLLLLMAGSPGLLFSQTETVSDSLDLIESDSTKIYSLGTVTVTDRRITRLEPLSQDLLRMAEINKSDAATVSEIIYEVPAARVQTNSRGESILYLRNAGERQVSIFMDGAMLNVPWDNRIDLSLVPLNAVGGLVTVKGTPSVLYGANVMGGAVNIVTRELESRGTMTELRGGAGENGLLTSSLTHMGNFARFNYIGAISFADRDGLPLSADADLAFNQPDADLRTNTDSRNISGYLRGEYHLNENNAVGLSLNVADAEKGVAPEGNTDDPRFWRYADWRNVNVTGTYDLKFGARNLWGIRGAAWTTLFTQRIEQYGSVEYDAVEAAQTDDDIAFGARIIFSREIEEQGRLSLSFNELYSGHDQVDSEFDSTGAEIEDPVQEYAQHTFSIGAEYDGRVSSRVNTVIGASLDGMTTVKSGDKPGQDPFMQLGLTGGATYALNDRNTLRVAVARKSRFPSMRELYGEALRRFLINTDLKPESSWNGEIGFERRFTAARLEVTGFTQLTSNTIDQRSLDTLGGTKRQRINLEGSRIFGVELSGSMNAWRPFRLNGHAVWSYVRAITSAADGSDSLTYLSEKPELLGTLNLGYDFPFGLLLDAEAVYNGTAYTRNDDNEFEELTASLAINGRIAYRWVKPVTGVQLLELYARIDNATDALVLPQLGLPAPGREIRGGFKLVL